MSTTTDETIRDPSAAPGTDADSAGTARAAEHEVVGGRWASRVNVAALWAAGMNNPIIARAFWRGAYGTDVEEFVRQWERIAEEPAGTRILDAPSGAGVFLLGIAPETDVHYTALDIAPSMVERVRQRAEVERLEQVRAVQGDATALPFPDESFDLVLTFNGLHCMNEPWKALAEFRRVLAADGRIRGTVLLRRPGIVAPRVQRYFQWRHLLGTIGTWAEVQTWFARAGLEVQRTHMSGALVFFEGRRADA
jgi:SAM-dependent methyltransferase